MNEQLEKKVMQAIRLLQSQYVDGETIEIAYSGGKDSDVILQLAKESGIKFRAIYKNTTIDPAGTIKHAKEMGAEVVRPTKTFFQLVAENGMPSRFMRFCCRYLKEYKILDKVVIGVRKSESKKRAKLYNEPIMCHRYSGKEKVQQILPILDWTDEDVKEFLKDRGIKVHPLYYDESGAFHVERRLGCLGCPLASNKKRIEQFRENPRYVRTFLYWMRKNKQKRYENEFDWFVRDLFFERENDFNEWKHSMFQEKTSKQYLEEFFNIKL